jgi:hypothetical protein
MPPRLPFALAGTFLLMGALFVVACGGDDDSSSSGTAPSSSGGTSQAQGSGSRDIKIEMNEWSFDLSDPVRGGLVKLTSQNKGKEPHQAQLVRWNDGVTQQQIEGALRAPDFGPMFNLVTFMGGPNTIPPGARQVVYNNLSPGNYTLLCFLEADDGMPHFAKGQMKNFTVAPGDSGDASSPKVDGGSVVMADFNFLGDVTSLPAKKTTIEVKNGGPQPHELTVIKLNNGITVDQIKAILNSDTPPGGPVPIDDAGGVGAMQANQTAYVEMDLKSGSYAFVCFVPDPATGKPHAALGMIKAIEVK